jgi:glutamate dehydrogenase
VTDRIEDARSARIAAAQSLVPGQTEATTRLRRFIAELYQRVPPSDIEARSPADLCGAATALWDFARHRTPGVAKVQVYNPTAGGDGWSSAHTIVEIVTDDMPFLVSSATAAINQAGHEVLLAIHPIVVVARNPSHELIELDPAAEGWAESWMQITITRQAGEDDRRGLASSLEGVLADVRHAVTDWSRMRHALHTIGATLAAPALVAWAGDIAEDVAFLRWLDDDNFTYLGFRDYDFTGAENGPKPPLGILADHSYSVFGGLRDLAALPSEVQEFVQRREPLFIAKTERRSTVHRAAHMDAIGIRRFGPGGKVIGVQLFLGLFTSQVYSSNARTIPLLRQKVRRTITRAGLATDGHDGKALAHIVDGLPRDELFQMNEDELFATAIGILNLQERQRVALFVRRDGLGRYASCLVFVPRERYDTRLSEHLAAILEAAFAGTVADFYTHLDDGVLARIQFVIRLTRGAVPPVDVAALERRLTEAGRSWSDRFAEAATEALGEGFASTRLRRLKPFPIAYQELTEPAQAVADLDPIEAVLGGLPLAASLHPLPGTGEAGLRLYRLSAPVPLSDVLPILENLGLRIIAEEPFRIEAVDGRIVWVHELTLESGCVPTPLTTEMRQRFEAAVLAVWSGTLESDGFNRLVLAAGLSGRQATVLRLYCKVMRQAGTTFSQAYMEETLTRHPVIARRLVELFEHRFDPGRAVPGSLAAVGEIQAIDHALDAVESLDEDRILRSYLTLILRTVRTNYYQTLPSGQPKPAFAVKLASHQLDLLPLPRPLYEIFVYSPRVEGVHMRAGKVARGGIRWSDRKEDFRTEILGLMKAQTVKNAVIVPVGSKGGFVLKRTGLSREEIPAEGIECYRTLIGGLLDLTDNFASEPNGGAHWVVPPAQVVRHDEDDPYLVVAADKGTATFSDIANGIAEERGFWLGDAFASGGSKGYDHKAIAITSRGAWELIKRHFRELGRDIQNEDFTVVGVGDMSGDVFGNGMLQSRHIRLLAAFNHVHIFIDPSPDVLASFAERERLFRLPRSSWADYDKAVISAGGGVFDRNLKAIAITPEMQRAFGISAERLTPAELIRHLLQAELDLLFFGGIGTFVKAKAENHAEVGDRANDALRVDGETLRAKVVGEVANLGVTQRGRVAYALKGGRIDTDAIDNSAGVSMSDHEVNIKILLGSAIAAGALGPQEREPLLAQMTDDVAALVLRDNYLQGEALSLAEARAAADFAGALGRETRLIRELERLGLLDRGLEFLPDDDTLAARAAAKQGLTRPELAVLLAYAKMALDHEIVVSDLPELPDLAGDLRDYFPPALRERFATHIAGHQLRREIAATVITNDLVNRAGITFVHDLQAQTGRTAPEIARAYRIVRAAFDLPELWASIEALDNAIPAEVQIEMLLDISGIVEHCATWLLRGGRLNLGRETARFAPAVGELAVTAPDLLPSSERTLYERRTARLTSAGVPAALASRIALLVFLTTAFEIGDLAERTGEPTTRAAQIFYNVGAYFALDEMRDMARHLPADTQYQKNAADAMIDEFYSLQSELAARVLAVGNGAADPLAAWVEKQAGTLTSVEALADELRAATAPDLAMLVVAGRRLRQALGS